VKDTYRKEDRPHQDDSKRNLYFDVDAYIASLPPVVMTCDDLDKIKRDLEKSRRLSGERLNTRMQ